MVPTTALDWRFGHIEVPAADRYIRHALELTGEYSGDEIDPYQVLLRPGDVALDIGAISSRSTSRERKDVRLPARRELSPGVGRSERRV